MRRILGFPGTIAPVVILLAILLALFGCYSGTRPPRIGTAAPDFTVRDSDHTITLSQLKGQVVVLNFWATWCQPCVEEVPSLDQFANTVLALGLGHELSSLIQRKTPIIAERR